MPKKKKIKWKNQTKMQQMGQVVGKCEEWESRLRWHHLYDSNKSGTNIPFCQTESSLPLSAILARRWIFMRQMKSGGRICQPSSTLCAHVVLY